MKKIISLLLMLLLLSSCAKKPAPTNPTVEGVKPMPAAAAEHDFFAQYIRLYKSAELCQDIADGITVCHSKADVDAFGAGGFDRDFESDGQSFNTLTSKYDDEYFKRNLLLICKVTEPSISNSHKVQKVTDEGVYIERIIPDSGDEAIGEWAILVECARFDANGIDLYLDGKNVTGTPADVKVMGGVTSLAIHIPEGWEYRENRFVSEEDEYGVYFKPEGEKGELYLNFRLSFGVCGTGLETKEITVAAYECSEMTWDGKEDFDIISFPCDYGAILIHNMSAEWLSDYKAELDTVLDSIKIERPTLTAERARELAEAKFGQKPDGYVMVKYELLRDTFVITFPKDGVDYSYAVYSNEVVKPNNLDAVKKEK